HGITSNAILRKTRVAFSVIIANRTATCPTQSALPPPREGFNGWSGDNSSRTRDVRVLMQLPPLGLFSYWQRNLRFRYFFRFDAEGGSCACAFPAHRCANG